MTIQDALLQIDEVKPNQMEKRQKIAWLTEVDGRIYHDIMLRHERDGGVPDTCPHYDLETDERENLLCPDPYSGMYRWYMEAQIDLINQEMDKYQNSYAQFNAAYGDYARKYKREHMPIQTAPRLIF